MEFKDTQIGPIPSKWELIYLEDVAKIIDSLHQTPKYSDKGCAMVRVTDIKQGYLSLKNCLMVDNDVYEVFTKNHKPEIGDIVISRVGTYGVFSYVRTSEKFCLGQNTAIISPKINSEYLYYCLLNKTTKEQIEKLVVGSTQKTLSLKSIKSINIPICSEKEQKNIAYILSRLDEKIEINNQINEKLQSISQLLFEQWFIDFEFPNEEGLPYKSSGGEMVDSELGMIPKGWKVKNITELVDSVSIKHKFDKNKIIFLNTSDILDGEILCRDYTDVEILPGQAKKSIRQDDILYSEIRPQNRRFAYIDFESDDYVVSTKLMVLRAKQNVSSAMIYVLLTSEKTINELQTIAESRSGTFPQITFSNLKDIKLAMPESSDFAYHTLFKTLLSKISHLKNENRYLSNLRDTLLPKLMSGEIDLSNLEINQ